ncbi:MAG: hypothetical protein SX243_08635 [Acidobacteriota bacterium]|nr:hypothetical protein [Acidobacteriota bacterium]
MAPQSALAQGETGNVCVRDYRGGAVCTANDVRIEALTVVSVVEDCVSGVPGETEVVFETLVSSDGSPDRYDIGLFLALDGGSARDGDNCYHDFLEPPLTTTPTYGDANSDTVPDITGGPWWDDDGDSCGDIESSTQVFKTLPPLRFACIDSDGDGSADVSVCTSWDNNSGSTCTTVVDAFPGTNSKCSCTDPDDPVELGIPPAPEITVVKAPATQSVPLGGTASFTFTVTSQTTVTNVVVSDNPSCDTLVGPMGDTNNDSILTPDETWIYTCDINNVMAGFMDTVTAAGDGPLGPVMDTDTATVTVAEEPAIGLAKRVTSFSDAGGGLFDIGIEMVVENLGNVALSNVQVTDDLDATFPAPVTYSIQAGPTASGTLTGNGGFDGSADQNLLNAGASTLAVGASGTIAFTVRINPNGAPGPFSNTATASGESPGGATPTDVSDDGTDPDPDGDGTADEPGENDPTPIDITEDPIIGVAKELTSITDVGGGLFDVAFSFVVENLGNVALSNVQVTDDLDATFPAPVTYSIQVAPAATGTLTANAGFNGSGDQNLLNAGASTLAIGASATITVTVRIDPNGASGPFQNTATASGDSPGGATPTDVSDDGTDPDPNGDGDPGGADEDDPTTVTITENPVIGVAKVVTSVTDAGGGLFDVAFSFVVENLGNVDLSNVQVTDDLDTTFPAPVTYSIQVAPAATGTLTANAGFNGSGDPNLLNAGASTLAVGASATITVTVRIDPNGATGPFFNQATASGESPGGTPTQDVSDDGTDPDPGGNGDPSDPGEDDPTSVDIPVVGSPALELIKTGLFNDENGDGVAQVGETITYFFEVTNIGTVDLSNVTVSDPLVTPINCPGGQPIATLSVSETVVCDGTYVLEQADIDAGEVVNVATADGMTPTGGQVTDTDTVTLPLPLVAIPTLSPMGLAALVLLLVGGGLVVLRRSAHRLG